MVSAFNLWLLHPASQEQNTTQCILQALQAARRADRRVALADRAMQVDGLYRTLARWRRNHLDPLFWRGARQTDRRTGVPPSKKAGSNRAASPAANSFVLYGAVFVGGAVASFMLVLAILTPSGRAAANRAPLVAAQLVRLT
nr:uncharacterized protein LOC129384166 [Dermacentor andersoni]